MAKRRGRRRSDRFISQAGLQALVRFGPEESGLRELQRQAESNYQLSAQQAMATSAGIQQAITPARKEIRGVYDQAGLRLARSAHTVEQDLAGLSGVANSIKAAASVESGAARNALSEARAASLGDLSTRRVQAVSAGRFGEAQARSQLVSELQKLAQRKQDLGREKGAFTAATAGQLYEAAANRASRVRQTRISAAQSERASMRSAGLDPDTGQPIAEGPLDPGAARYRDGRGPGGRKPRTSEQHEAAASDISSISQKARQLKGAGLSRSEIVEALSRGRPARSEQRVPLKDPATGDPIINPDGTPKTKVTPARPAIPAFKPDLRMSAALDLALDGTLGKTTQRRLQRAGFSVKDLGVPTYGSRRKPRRRRSAPAQRPPSTYPGSGF